MEPLTKARRLNIPITKLKTESGTKLDPSISFTELNDSGMYKNNSQLAFTNHGTIHTIIDENFLEVRRPILILNKHDYDENITLRENQGLLYTKSNDPNLYWKFYEGQEYNLTSNPSNSNPSNSTPSSLTKISDKLKNQIVTEVSNNISEMQEVTGKILLNLEKKIDTTLDNFQIKINENENQIKQSNTFLSTLIEDNIKNLNIQIISNLETFKETTQKTITAELTNKINNEIYTDLFNKISTKLLLKINIPTPEKATKILDLIQSKITSSQESLINIINEKTTLTNEKLELLQSYINTINEKNTSPQDSLINFINEKNTLTQESLINTINEKNTSTQESLINFINEKNTSTQESLINFINEKNTLTNEKLELLQSYINTINEKNTLTNEKNTSTQDSLINFINEKNTSTQESLINFINEKNTSTQDSLINFINEKTNLTNEKLELLQSQLFNTINEKTTSTQISEMENINILNTKIESLSDSIHSFIEYTTAQNEFINENFYLHENLHNNYKSLFMTDFLQTDKIASNELILTDNSNNLNNSLLTFENTLLLKNDFSTSTVQTTLNFVAGETIFYGDLVGILDNKLYKISNINITKLTEIYYSNILFTEDKILISDSQNIVSDSQNIISSFNPLSQIVNQQDQIYNIYLSSPTTITVLLNNSSTFSFTVPETKFFRCIYTNFLIIVGFTTSSPDKDLYILFFDNQNFKLHYITNTTPNCYDLTEFNNINLALSITNILIISIYIYKIAVIIPVNFEDPIHYDTFRYTSQDTTNCISLLPDNISTFHILSLESTAMGILYIKSFDTNGLQIEQKKSKKLCSINNIQPLNMQYDQDTGTYLILCVENSGLSLIIFKYENDFDLLNKYYFPSIQAPLFNSYIHIYNNNYFILIDNTYYQIDKQYLIKNCNFIGISNNDCEENEMCEITLRGQIFYSKIELNDKFIGRHIYISNEYEQKNKFPDYITCSNSEFNTYLGQVLTSSIIKLN